MIIYGLQKTTLIDYPGKIACTVFTYGCNFRCSFCHNPELVIDPIKEAISDEDFFRFLEKRKGMLDGVVITGGEPCIHEELIGFIRKIKDMNFSVKLDTNGSFPNILKIVIEENLVDYVAMDIKSSEDKYVSLSGGFDNFSKILQSIKTLRASNIAYEFRTTVIKGLHTKKEIEKIGKILEGTENFSLQNFKFTKTISSEFTKSNEFTKDELDDLAKILKKYIQNVEIKNIY